MKDEQKKGFSERDWDLLFFLMFKNSSENAKRQLPRSEWSFRLFRRYGNQIFAIRTDADRGSPQREWTGERCRRASCHAPTRLDHAPDSCRHADWPIPAIGPATEDRNRFVRSNRKLLAHEFAQVAHSSDLLFIFSAANTKFFKALTNHFTVIFFVSPELVIFSSDLQKLLRSRNRPNTAGENGQQLVSLDVFIFIHRWIHVQSRHSWAANSTITKIICGFIHSLPAAGSLRSGISGGLLLLAWSSGKLEQVRFLE